MHKINDVLGKIEGFISKPWFNIFATVYINFRTCNFSEAIKLPIFIYGSIYFDSLKGNINFKCDIKPGIVKIGQVAAHFSSPKGKVYIFLKENSLITFKGNCLILIDTSIRLTENSKLVLGNGVLVGDEVKIMCENYIEIGDNSRISFGTQIIDTNFHYIEEFENNLIRRKNEPIIIGANNWIGNHSTIMKGARTCEWCILASGSLLNKVFETKNVILAGRPAKVVGENKKRIFSSSVENMLDNYFKINPESEFYSENSFDL